MKLLDKLKVKVKIDKKMFIFFLTIMLVGIIVGSIFVSVLNSSDKGLIHEYLTNFLDNVQAGSIDYGFVFKSNMISTLVYIAIIWLLGISVIGLPVILVMFFSKSFILGFTIGSIIQVFGFKGTLFALLYVFPGQIISLLMLLFLSIYAVSFCIKLIYVLFKKQAITFKVVMHKYLIVLAITAIISIIMVFSDTYLMPRLVHMIIGIIR